MVVSALRHAYYHRNIHRMGYFQMEQFSERNQSLSQEPSTDAISSQLEGYIEARFRRLIRRPNGDQDLEARIEGGTAASSMSEKKKS